MDYTTKSSGHKNDILFCNNFKYCFKNRNKDESSYWICRNIGCSASVTTKDGRIIKVSGQRIIEAVDLKPSHNQLCEPLSHNEILIDDSLSRVKNNSPSQAYYEEQTKLCPKLPAEEVAESFPQFNQIRGALYSQKLKNFPKLLTSLESIQINGK